MQRSGDTHALVRYIFQKGVRGLLQALFHRPCCPRGSWLLPHGGKRTLPRTLPRALIPAHRALQARSRDVALVTCCPPASAPQWGNTGIKNPFQSRGCWAHATHSYNNTSYQTTGKSDFSIKSFKAAKFNYELPRLKFSARVYPRSGGVVDVDISFNPLTGGKAILTVPQCRWAMGCVGFESGADNSSTTAFSKALRPPPRPHVMTSWQL